MNVCVPPTKRPCYVVKQLTPSRNGRSGQTITKLKIDSNPFAKGFRDSSRLTEFERETMESMLSEQHLLRPPLLDGSSFSLQEQAMLAARSQLLMQAAAAAAGSPYSMLGPMGPLYAAGAVQQYGGESAAPLWSQQWACLGRSLLATQHLAAATSAATRPIYPSPSLTQQRFAPYCIPRFRKTPVSPVSSPDSLREANDSSPHSPS